MDRNSAIGLSLIVVLLVAYFYWFSPAPEKPVEKTVTTESAHPAAADTLKAPATPSDSTLAATYGDLSGFMKGDEAITNIETEDLKIGFSNKGGVIKSLELKKFKTYHKQPLLLIDPTATSFSLKSTFKGQDLDLYKLYYQPSRSSSGDSTVLVFKVELSDGSSFTQRYSIPQKGYEIGYSLSSTGGFEKQLGTDNLNLLWNQAIKPSEKDVADTRTGTTITYFTSDDGFDELNARSKDALKESLTATKWVTIKQKYFLSSIIAKDQFGSGELALSTPPETDTSLVKLASVTLTIPKKDLAAGKTSFKLYLGPNDYQIIGDVADKFAKNVYLGWPPVYWVNKFVIFPVFHFLTMHIANYGIIIIVLVILLKLVLAPLSYRSYLSMAKMKVLKPELDEIKEKNAEDPTKAQQEQLKLYQQVGVNPISGCVPVLLQMPILFAMFYLFPASIELRQQPLLWAEDLSTYDSLIHFSFSLPILGNHLSLFTLLMTASTLIYTWQNNQLSSVQGPMKSMSYIMPVVFFFVLNSFSAGLTFYYFISNLVTFAQQAIIKRFVNEDKIKEIMEENRKKNLTGSGKKSKFMSKLEDAMKAGEEARRANDEAKRKKKK